MPLPVNSPRIHNLPVPVADYTTLERFEKIAFGLTPATWPDSMAHQIALNAAIEGLSMMRAVVQRQRRKR